MICYEAGSMSNNEHYLGLVYNNNCRGACSEIVAVANEIQPSNSEIIFVFQNPFNRRHHIRPYNSKRHTHIHLSDTFGVIEHVKSTQRYLSMSPEDNMHGPMMIVVHKPCCTFFHDGHKSDDAGTQQCYPL